MTNRFKFCLSLVALIIVSACKVPQHTTTLDKVNVPATFPSAKEDSVGIASITWSKFFGDTLLTALIETGISKNQNLKNVEYKVIIALNNLTVARASLLPSFRYEVRGGQEKMGDYTMNGVGNYDTNLSDRLTEDQRIPSPVVPDYFVGIRSSWEIDIWGKLRNQKQARLKRFMATKGAYHLATTELVSQIAIFYYELLGLDSELKVIRQNILLQQKALELMQLQKEAGRVSQLAVQQTQAQLLFTQSLERETIQQIVDTENQLNFVVGRYPQPILRSSLDEQHIPDHATPGLPHLMMENRPDIRQATLELEAAGYDANAANAALYPTLELSAMTGFNSFSSSLLFNLPGSFVHAVFSGLSGPIFNRNLLRTEKRNAEVQARIAYQHYEQTVIHAYQESLGHLYRVENLNAMADFKKQEAQMLSNAVSTSKDLFVTGFASYLEVVTAQRSKLEAELQLAIIKKNQLIAITNLYRSLGGGWK